MPSPVTLITGAGSGIGRATAILLASRGHKLALSGRRAAALSETIAALPAGAEAVAVPTDIADPAQADSMIDRAASHYGRLDTLINNAGAAPLAPIDQTTHAMLDEAFRTNAIGPAAAIARAWPIFARHRRGLVINISTYGTLDPFPGFFAYAASKAALNLMAKSCAKEGAAIGVRAFAIAPPAVETGMLRANFGPDILPPDRCLRPEDIAQVILECIEGARDDQNGETIFVPPR